MTRTQRRRISPARAVLIVAAIALLTAWLLTRGSGTRSAVDWQREYGGSTSVYTEILSGSSCSDLQATFDRASGNNAAAVAGSAEHRWTLGYLSAADDRMRALGCY